MDRQPYYSTHAGKAYLGDSLDVMREMPASSVNLVMTSPPFALTFKKEYGNEHQDDYVDWFCQYAGEIRRILTDDGSFVVDLGGAWNKGKPTRSLYVYRLVLAVCDVVGFHLAQDFFWFRPAALPAPAEWVNVQRIRVKDAVNQVFWFSKSPRPKADNRRVLVAYSEDMKRLIRNGYRPKLRPSGHNITEKFDKDLGGAIPPNLLSMGNNDASGPYMAACAAAGIKPHPARFPIGIPSFFINLCTESKDMVLDPFGGSNTTGYAAQTLDRRWVCIESHEPYLSASALRFPEGVTGPDGRHVTGLIEREHRARMTRHQPSLFETLSAD
ncbi:MAG: site-specific DNA-methyltransferase [Chloroflexi bacterium]|nr:site-specific DNA-methyltransferase [Chloroflexota bacterium]